MMETALAATGLTLGTGDTLSQVLLGLGLLFKAVNRSGRREGFAPTLPVPSVKQQQ